MFSLSGSAGLGTLGLALATLALVPAARAQITVDGTLGPAMSLAGPNYAIGANLGRQAGGNLFHSFGLFNLMQSEKATFSGPSSVQNVIGRVTGGASSSINGTIASTIPGASLFLINPAGIVFGPSARLDVQGSFHASTADYVGFADGARFFADPLKTSSFTVAAPASFGFLNANPQGITVDASSLAVPTGATLSFVAGPIAIIDNAQIAAPAGTFHATAVAGAGEVGVDPASGPFTVASLGSVTVSGSNAQPLTTIDVSDTATRHGGGRIFIRAGNLVVSSADIFNDNLGSEPGGTTSLRGDSSIALKNSAVSATGFGSGRGGDVTVTTGKLTMDGAVIAADTVGPGNGGNVTVSAGSVELRTGSSISSDTFGPGNAGNVQVTSSGAILIDGTGALDTAITANAIPLSTGNAGNVTVDAGSLQLQGGGEITTVTLGPGRGGDVKVTSSGAILIDDTGSIGPFTGISASNGLSSGNAGNVTVNAASLQIKASGLINSSTSTQGRGGVVKVTTSGPIAIDGTTASGSAPTGISADARTGSTGDAGNVIVSAGSIQIQASGRISSGALGSGRGGNVQVTASGPIAIDGAGSISFTGITADAEPGPTGNAGTVSVTAGSLQIRAGGDIGSNTFGQGRGGDVRVSASGPIEIDGTGSGGALTGISAKATTGSTGNAGNLTVNVGDLTIKAGGSIASSTVGQGRGGDIKVTASGTVSIDGADSGGFLTGISALSLAPQPAGNVAISADRFIVSNGGALTTQSSTAGGGSVDIRLGTLLELFNGRITTSVQGGLGNGGNITVDPQFIALNHGTIIANAFGGNGGNITLVAGTFFQSPDTRIQASSQLGISGQIAIEAPSIDVTGGLTVLNANFLDASALLRQSCAARAGAPRSSLLPVGRGALPVGPDDALPGLYFANPAAPPAGGSLDAPVPAVAAFARFAFDRSSLACGG